MFSGKTTELIRMVRVYSSIGYKILTIKPKLDNRYVSDKVTSHDMETVQCTVVSTLKEIQDNDNLDVYDIIAIEEGQFFPDLYNFCIETVESLGKKVIVAGLDGDSSRVPFGDIPRLIPLADTVNKLTAMCSYCKNGTKALFSLRLSSSVSQVDIGGADKYAPVCRKHYLSYK
jgi:thymidine kinase